MIEKNTFAYNSPSKCMSRQQELAGSKPEKEIQLDASKTSLVVKEQLASRDISIASDLVLFQAIQWRSLAMDLTGLATYEVMKKWTDRLFNIYSQSVAPGFHKVSQAQLLRADRQAFVRLGELFTGLLKQTTGPGKVLDPYIAQLENDVTVTYFMLPLPISHTKSDPDDKGNKKRPDPAAKQNDDAPPKPPKKTPKGAGKGKHKRDPVPQGLKGMHSRTPKGEPICFGFNLGTCSSAACKRKHVCAVPGCYKQHPQSEHQ